MFPSALFDRRPALSRQKPFGLVYRLVGGVAETFDKLLKFSLLLFFALDSRTALTGLLLSKSHEISMH